MKLPSDRDILFMDSKGTYSYEGVNGKTLTADILKDGKVHLDQMFHMLRTNQEVNTKTQNYRHASSAIFEPQKSLIARALELIKPFEEQLPSVKKILKEQLKNVQNEQKQAFRVSLLETKKTSEVLKDLEAKSRKSMTELLDMIEGKGFKMKIANFLGHGEVATAINNLPSNKTFDTLKANMRELFANHRTDLDARLSFTGGGMSKGGLMRAETFGETVNVLNTLDAGKDFLHKSSQGTYSGEITKKTVSQKQMSSLASEAAKSLNVTISGKSWTKGQIQARKGVMGTRAYRKMRDNVKLSEANRVDGLKTGFFKSKFYYRFNEKKREKVYAQWIALSEEEEFWKVMQENQSLRSSFMVEQMNQVFLKQENILEGKAGYAQALQKIVDQFGVKSWWKRGSKPLTAESLYKFYTKRTDISFEEFDWLRGMFFLDPDLDTEELERGDNVGVFDEMDLQKSLRDMVQSNDTNNVLRQALEKKLGASSERDLRLVKVKFIDSLKDLAGHPFSVQVTYNDIAKGTEGQETLTLVNTNDGVRGINSYLSADFGQLSADRVKQLAKEDALRIKEQMTGKIKSERVAQEIFQSRVINTYQKTMSLGKSLGLQGEFLTNFSQIYQKELQSGLKGSKLEPYLRRLGAVGDSFVDKVLVVDTIEKYLRSLGSKKEDVNPEMAALMAQFGGGVKDSKEESFFKTGSINEKELRKKVEEAKVTLKDLAEDKGNPKEETLSLVDALTKIVNGDSTVALNKGVQLTLVEILRQQAEDHQESLNFDHEVLKKYTPPKNPLKNFWRWLRKGKPLDQRDLEAVLAGFKEKDWVSDLSHSLQKTLSIDLLMAVDQKNNIVKPEFSDESSFNMRAVATQALPWIFHRKFKGESEPGLVLDLKKLESLMSQGGVSFTNFRQQLLDVLKKTREQGEGLSLEESWNTKELIVRTYKEWKSLVLYLYKERQVAGQNLETLRPLLEDIYSFERKKVGEDKSQTFSKTLLSEKVSHFNDIWIQLQAKDKDLKGKQKELETLEGKEKAKTKVKKDDGQEDADKPAEEEEDKKEKKVQEAVKSLESEVDSLQKQLEKILLHKDFLDLRRALLTEEALLSKRFEENGIEAVSKKITDVLRAKKESAEGDKFNKFLVVVDDILRKDQKEEADIAVLNTELPEAIKMMDSILEKEDALEEESFSHVTYRELFGEEAYKDANVAEQEGQDDAKGAKLKSEETQDETESRVVDIADIKPEDHNTQGGQQAGTLTELRFSSADITKARATTKSYFEDFAQMINKTGNLEGSPPIQLGDKMIPLTHVVRYVQNRLQGFYTNNAGERVEKSLTVAVSGDVTGQTNIFKRMGARDTIDFNAFVMKYKREAFFVELLHELAHSYLEDSYPGKNYLHNPDAYDEVRTRVEADVYRLQYVLISSFMNLRSLKIAEKEYRRLLEEDFTLKITEGAERMSTDELYNSFPLGKRLHVFLRTLSSNIGDDAFIGLPAVVKEVNSKEFSDQLLGNTKLMVAT
jgi:hypothetical protein